MWISRGKYSGQKGQKVHGPSVVGVCLVCFKNVKETLLGIISHGNGKS